MIAAALKPEQEEIRAAAAKVCAKFDLDYWLKKDRAIEEARINPDPAFESPRTPGKYRCNEVRH